MAMIPFGNQFAVFPRVAKAAHPYVPQFAKFPTFNPNSTVPTDWQLRPLIHPLPLPNARQIFPQFVSGSPVPIPGGQRLTPILPLPGGGGGGGGGGAVGSPIDSG